jgi:transcriptional regulator with XRE-family HTH domain
MIQRPSIAVRSVPADPELSRLEHDEREVLACFHCRLVQYRTRTSLCRRCHKPLESEVRNRTDPEAAFVRSDSTPMNVSDAVKNIGVRVRGFRNERRLTQCVLASRMNVPRTYISKVEMGRVVPTLGTLSRIAVALEVTVTDLLSNEAERRRENEMAHILADPFLTEIARVVEKLSAVQRALILRAVHDATNGRCHHQQVST